MKTIIFRCHSENEDYSADCDFAVLHLDHEVVELLRTRLALARNAKEADSSLFSLEFWDCRLEYYSYDLEDSLELEQQEALDNAEYTIIDVVTGEPQRTECDQVVVSPDGYIHWKACPKHCSFYVSTPDIKLSDLEALL